MVVVASVGDPTFLSAVCARASVPVGEDIVVDNRHVCVLDYPFDYVLFFFVAGASPKAAVGRRRV